MAGKIETNESAMKGISEQFAAASGILGELKREVCLCNEEALGEWQGSAAEIFSQAASCRELHMKDIIDKLTVTGDGVEQVAVQRTRMDKEIGGHITEAFLP